MVLTAAQTTAFFENNDQMGIPHKTMVQLQHEGVQSVADLADFDKDSLQQLTDNLRKPRGRIPDPNPNADAGATIPTPAFIYQAKSQKRLAVACNLIRYYQTVGRDLTASNIQWNQVMSNFEIQWKALKERKDEDDPEVPYISKALPIIKWTEAFQDFLNRVIGVRMIHLLPYDPVAKKRSSRYKRGSTQTSSLMEASDATTKKPSIGKTGVHLHYLKSRAKG